MSYVKNHIDHFRHVILVLAGILLAGACGELKPDYEAPTVNVSYFRPLPAQGLAPRFEIGLHVINPNNFELDIRGVAYSVFLQGQRILVGVARDLPAIPAYGEGDIRLQATTDVINSIRLIAGLMRQQRDDIGYKFDAKLDIKGFARKVHVERKGTFSFSGEK